MKESDTEGVAIHGGPESCVGPRKLAGEALTGVHAGQLLSREIKFYQGADAVHLRGRQYGVRVNASGRPTLRGRRT